METGKIGQTLEQTEILYNLEMYKTTNDVNKSGKKVALKTEWLNEWKHYMEEGFSSFVEDENVVLHWYSIQDLHDKISPILRKDMVQISITGNYAF